MYFRTIFILSGLLSNSLLSIGNGSYNLRLNRGIVDSNKLSKKYQPDTAINKTIYLCNSSSIITNFGDLMNQVNGNADIPYIIFLNQKGNQYLKMLFYPGDTKNSFSEFEIGYTIDSLSNKSAKSSFVSFETESGIKLGTTKQEIINKKGNGYILKTEKSITCIRYVLSESSKSQFLNRYNMPLYYSEYLFKG